MSLRSLEVELVIFSGLFWVDVAKERDWRLVFNLIPLASVTFIFMAGHQIVYSDSTFERRVAL